MDIFNTIYKYNLWIKGSGTGSIIINNKPYIHFLNKFLKDNDIKSVIDIGCGDWQISKNIDWNNIKYLGIDIVKNVIDYNVNEYSKSNIKFLCKDITEYINIPNADLYIIKDVLQHLSNDKINKIIEILKTKKNTHILIINDICTINTNININDGMYRPLDILKKPFKCNVEKVFEYHEKLYIIFYILYLLAIIYLVYVKGYKLYYSMLLILIIYGLLLFPKKVVYKLTI